MKTPTVSRKQVRNVGKSVEENQKAVMIIAGVGLAFLLVRGISKRISSGSLFNTKAETEQAATEQEKQTSKDLSGLTKKGIKPTYTDSQYKIFANSLEESMNGWFGTDEKAVHLILVKLYNDADFLKLNQAFGFRRMEFTLKYGDLSMWIRSDFADDKLGFEICNEILKQRGITYRF